MFCLILAYKTTDHIHIILMVHSNIWFWFYMNYTSYLVSNLFLSTIVICEISDSPVWPKYCSINSVPSHFNLKILFHFDSLRKNVGWRSKYGCTETMISSCDYYQQMKRRFQLSDIKFLHYIIFFIKRCKLIKRGTPNM